MSSISKDDFTTAYSKVLVAAWSDEDFAQRLHEDPHAVLAEVGLEIDRDVTVRIIEAQQETDPSADGLELQYQAWIKADSVGGIDLVVPDAPKIEQQNLNDSELEAVAGGIACCCCPCCCCC